MGIPLRRRRPLRAPDPRPSRPVPSSSSPLALALIGVYGYGGQPVRRSRGLDTPAGAGDCVESWRG